MHPRAAHGVGLASPARPCRIGRLVNTSSETLSHSHSICQNYFEVWLVWSWIDVLAIDEAHEQVV